jgi:predicted nucleic acid-binding Zn ribbon protein
MSVEIPPGGPDGADPGVELDVGSTRAGDAGSADGSPDPAAAPGAGLDVGSARDDDAGLPDGPPGPAAAPGIDLARSALDAARSAARRGPADRAGRRVAGRRGRVGGAQRGYTAAGPDPRDPQRFGALLRRLVADRGWEATVATVTVLARWEALVGAEIAGHCRPVSLRDGELTLAAESTAWATQLRLLAPTLLGRIRAELGPEVVRRVRVHGPTAPSWGAGPRRIAGRGPRDTYG